MCGTDWDWSLCESDPFVGVFCQVAGSAMMLHHLGETVRLARVTKERFVFSTVCVYEVVLWWPNGRYRPAATQPTIHEQHLPERCSPHVAGTMLQHQLPPVFHSQVADSGPWIRPLSSRVVRLSTPAIQLHCLWMLTLLRDTDRKSRLRPSQRVTNLQIRQASPCTSRLM